MDSCLTSEAGEQRHVRAAHVRAGRILASRFAVLVTLSVFLSNAGVSVAADVADAKKTPAASAADIRRWIGELDSDEFRVREAATVALGKAGKAAVPLVLRAAEDGNAEVRSRASSVLPELFKSLEPIKLVSHEESNIPSVARAARKEYSRRAQVAADTFNNTILMITPSRVRTAGFVDMKFQASSDRHYEVLSTFLSLHKLRLHGDDLNETRMLHVARIPQLADLTIRDAEKCGDCLKHLDQLKHLKRLDFSRSLIDDSGFARIPVLRNVECLYLSDTKITDRSLLRLKGWSELRLLTLDDVDVTGEGLAALGNLHQLHTLIISSEAWTERGIEHLASIRSLKHLELGSGCNVGRGWRRLSQLQKLETARLYGRGITDKSLVGLAKVKSLWILDVSQTNVTDVGMSYLAASSIRFLDISGRKITGKGAKYLGEIESLCNIDASSTAIDDDGLRHLSGLRLHSLKLKNTPITNAGLAHVRHMADLEVLDLSNTRVSDKGLTYLKDSKIKVLDLDGTAVSDDGLTVLAGMKSLAEVEVGGTQVTDEGLARLRRNCPNLIIRH